jgi:hypothetical protein
MVRGKKRYTYLRFSDPRDAASNLASYDWMASYKKKQPPSAPGASKAAKEASSHFP